MSRAATQEVKKPAGRSAANCVHHWLIEAPSGRESTGVCKHCGTKKSFANSNDSVMWEQTNTIRHDLRESTRSSRREVRLADEE
jgi:hypothetical protein